jgi:hypothetical protein
MATIMEMLNQGIGGLNTPLGQLGTQLLANSGPQAGNPSGGARMGQALAGMSEVQRVQALQAHRNQQDQLAAQYQQMQLQQYQAKQAQAQHQQQAFQNPALQAQLGPISRQLAQLGLDPETILRAQSNDSLNAHRQAQLAQSQGQFDMRQANAGGGGNGGDRGAKAGTPRQVLDESLGDDLWQRHVLDPTTGSYRPYGKPFNKHSPKSKAATGAEAVVDQVAPDPQADSQLPGQGPLSSYAKQPMQGAELLMHGSGSNPMARPPATSQPQYPGAPAVGTVRKGFKFLGGNPADPKSWGKQ